MIFSRPAYKTMAVFIAMLLTGCAAQKKSDVSTGNGMVGGAGNGAGSEAITRTIPKTKIIYAAQNIAKGEIVSRKAIEEREIWLSKLPNDAITDSALAIGRVAKYDVASGEVISIQDLGESKAGTENKVVVKIIFSKEEQEKLARKAEDNHQTTSELAKSWILERLKK